MDPGDWHSGLLHVATSVFEEGQTMFERVSSRKVNVDLYTENLLQSELDSSLDSTDVVDATRHHTHHGLQVGRSDYAHPASDTTCRITCYSAPSID
jgi:hypothetical protein